MKLGKIVAYLGFKGVSFCGNLFCSLCSLYVPTGFGGRAESEVSRVCLFHKGVLATGALVEGRA